MTATGLTTAINYAPGSAGGVVIGASSAWNQARSQLKLYVNGGVTANSMPSFSDESLKTDISELADTLPRVLKMNGYTYRRAEDGRDDA